MQNVLCWDLELGRLVIDAVLLDGEDGDIAHANIVHVVLVGDSKSTTFDESRVHNLCGRVGVIRSHICGACVLYICEMSKEGFRCVKRRLT